MNDPAPAIGRLLILGLGLIGGSLALALKQAGQVQRVSAWGRRTPSLEKGLEDRIIDDYSLDLETALEGADMVVVATPTIVAEDVLLRVLKIVLPTTPVTDVASVKGNLLHAVEAEFGSAPPNLVLGHPIAGSEQSGVGAARPDLFVNHNVILTPVATTAEAALRQVSRMWEFAGANINTLTVADHDTVLAATSHLPHLLAYSLVDSLAHLQRSKDIFRYAAGGFRDFTRIASSDPTMWAEISLANRDAMLAVLDKFTDDLALLRKAVEAGDRDTLMQTFGQAKQSRDEFARVLADRHAGNHKETY
jgi:prephenate dehydrogenase